MSGAGKIADFAASAVKNGVPEDVLAAARLHFLDAIGVGIAAASVSDNATWSQAATPGDASLLGGEQPKPVPQR